MNTSSVSMPPTAIVNGRQRSIRERAASNVSSQSRIRTDLTDRSSVNLRSFLNARHIGNRMFHQQNTDNIHRSNSSLELIHGENTSGTHHESLNYLDTSLRREYGSHGSIDVIASDRTLTTGESFFAMLQDYRPAVLGIIGTDQRSPGPAEYLKGKVNDVNHDSVNASTTGNHPSYVSESNEDCTDRNSPKPRNKFQKLWGPMKPGKMANHLPATDECSLITTLSADIEERQRRRAFAHFDCQSLTANLGYAAKLRELLLARRRNTTTGASAASMMNSRSFTPDGGAEGLEDYGDGQNNDLLENCSFFRNEIGGEEEREVSLTRFQSNNGQKRAIHRPALACGVSILECPTGECLWKQNTCPFQRGIRPIECIDNGAKYYRQYFFEQEHQNWFGIDEQLGPIAISIKREKIPNPNQTSEATASAAASKDPIYQFRLIVRTSELLTLRGSVIEDSVPNLKGSGKSVSTKEVLEYVVPEVQISSLRLGVSTPQCEQQLLKLDEQGLTNKYKVGILYCRAGQNTEEEMYNNEETGPIFAEFLETIGKRVRLKGFEYYKAGLDNKTDSTGTHSLYTTYQDCEVMFHVSTMLPFTPNNRQQLLRKRHIGNDIVTIVFQEPGSLPFTPKNIRSQFQHVFIIVQAINPCTDNTYYKVSVSRSKEVPVFGPPIRSGAIYPKSNSFTEFLIAKVINAENAVHRSEKFVTMATRTRQEYLKDLSTNYCTTTLVDSGPKFSIFPSKKKERPKPRFNGDVIQRGAFCWQVVLHDNGQATTVDCFLGISTETFVLIEECSRQIVFVTPCKSILGWSTSGYCIRIYHHQSECVTLSMRESAEHDEQLEVIERLRAVTKGCGAIELNLRRNSMGQLGFHVQPDGVVTQVETSGQAWGAGLRQGYRLVEICKVAVSTLSHDEMVDLLKTSSQVTITVIESFSDSTPRRGCFLPNCKFNVMNFEGDYENLDEKPKQSSKNPATAQLKQPGSSHRRRYERNFSPPRSSNSSGYGTGSSSRSFILANDQMRMGVDMGTLTSSSSGHSSNDDRWYDIIEVTNSEEDAQSTNEFLPPPQPAQYYRHKQIEHTSSLPGGARALPGNVDHSSTTSVDYLVTKTPKIPDLNEPQSIIKNQHLSIRKPVNTDPIYNVSLKSNSSINDEELSVNDLLPLKRSATTSSVHKAKSSIENTPLNNRKGSQRPINEAKLRPGSANRNLNNLQQRNSANYSSSTLQEDLMKLINPDYIKSNDDNFHHGNLSQLKPQKNITNSHSMGNIAAINNALKSTIITDDLLLMRKKSRSREGINLGSSHEWPIANELLFKSDDISKSDSEVIFTTARPATVISAISGGASDKNDKTILHIKEDNLRSSPRKENLMGMSKRKISENLMQQLPVINDSKEVDWVSLVDNAIIQVNEGLKQTDGKSHLYEPINVVSNSDYSSIVRSVTNSSSPALSLSNDDGSNSQQTHEQQKSNPVTSSTSVPDLQNQVSLLEDRVSKETRRRKSLEQVVRRLTEDNRRLQDESQAAVQQLRRFTEWFFQTIDKQS